QKRIGDSWRFRYKSLVLFTTKSYSALPGLEMKGDPNSYPTKNEMADYLEDYVAHFDLPYRMNTLATRIEKENDFFNIFTVNEKIQSRRVIVASGAVQKLYIPPIIKNENTVVSHELKFLPLEIFRKSMFYWLEKLQLLYAGTDTIRGRLFQKRNDPIFGRELKQAIKSRNVKIKPRVTVVDGKKVTFSDGSSLD